MLYGNNERIHELLRRNPKKFFRLRKSKYLVIFLLFDIIKIVNRGVYDKGTIMGVF